ncbi:3-phosphoglycerate dehydrogenase [Faecalicatena contorta]|uniref:2-hydroxyacid dehydrogenase n=1 Tax=Faecalicatena contorta TaxID=39482 RepID=UPI00129E14F2|nr:2-hydroxyacid dehydrogenase [Faecalicatena contorta]MRM86876.1 3-phosphoglycerate dehydrogenase [Faecalicatena contorta]
MKILCICDGYINRGSMPVLHQLEEIADEVVYYDDPVIDTLDKTMECMSATEAGGPEGYPVPDEMYGLAEEADMIVVHMAPIPKKLIDSAKKLKFVAVMRGGCNNVDVNYLCEKGITVVNAAARSSDSVADATVAMMLAETRNIARSYAALKHEGTWLKKFPNTGNIHDLATRTIGIIGIGCIGARVARRLEGFGAKIIVHDPYVPDEKIKEMGYEPVTKEELCRRSDIVTIHLRESEATNKFIGEKELALMKPTTTIVNTARAGLIDEEALIKALEERRIQGAALDVFDIEPLPAGHPFLGLDNVTITSHLAGSSNDVMVNSFTIIFEDLKRYMNHQEVRGAVKQFKG